MFNFFNGFSLPQRTITQYGIKNKGGPWLDFIAH